MTVAWVLGSGGLLGTALCRALRRDGTELFFPERRFDWESTPALGRQFAAAVRAFSKRVGTAGRWEIYWAAGVGSMGSSDAALAQETAALSVLLGLVASESQLIAANGAFALASSAGAIYAGASDHVITENTPPAPTTAYAREKLRQEALVRSFALGCNGISAMIARISTLYGPGQAAGKQHGLLSHMARRMLQNQPIQIFIPFDTIRDYIAADDAAAAIVAALRAATGKPGVLTKIIASEQPTTIAEIISVFKRIARRAPRIVTSASNLSGLYSRRVVFKSVVAPECSRSPTVTLLVGVAQLLAAERAALVRSSSIRHV